ncbi:MULTISPECIES: hypothetical protein [Nitrosospira]|uniref:hypothetical protein n=1 Tax=Nitrosospira TaxID=35798 RepID=UPI0009449332|nr:MULTISPECIES: hypothetical protein [Nitrosospira]
MKKACLSNSDGEQIILNPVAGQVEGTIFEVAGQGATTWNRVIPFQGIANNAPYAEKILKPGLERTRHKGEGHVMQIVFVYHSAELDKMSEN